MEAQNFFLPCFYAKHCQWTKTAPLITKNKIQKKQFEFFVHVPLRIDLRQRTLKQHVELLATMDTSPIQNANINVAWHYKKSLKKEELLLVLLKSQKNVLHE